MCIVVSVPGGETTRLTDTAEGEGGARFAPDGVRLAFSRGGNVFVLHTGTGVLRQVTRDGRAGGPTWSPDGRWLTVSVGDPPIRLTASPSYSGSLITYLGSQGTQRDAALVAVDTAVMRRIEASPDQESVVDWSPDSTKFLLERVSIDVKDKTLFVCDVEPLACRSLFQQRDDKYLPSNDQMASFSPDSKSILFTSDRTGWNHLYLVPTGGGTPRQLTDGRFEVSFASWNHDGQRIFFTSTEVATAERHVYAISPTGGDRLRLTTEAGVNTTLAVSPVRDELAFVDPTRVTCRICGSRTRSRPRSRASSPSP